MSVTIGSARSDERGKITGGKAGDQNKGREVSTQGWYKHSKGWRVFRCKIPEARPLIAKNMQQACSNNNIGYDQNQRTTLRRLLDAAKWLISKITTKCETDCSALVGDCITCALRQLGRKETIPNFNTSTQAKTLLNTGLFEELKGSKYTDQDDYLMGGDILVTKTKGHTVICITSGDKAGAEPAPDKVYNLGDRILRNGCKGPDVKELQSLMIQLDYNLGKWGADGDFGDATEDAVRFLQKKAQLTIDGEVGPETLKALEKELKVEDGDGDPENAKYVRIKGGNCYVRKEPKVTGDNALGVVYEGKLLPYKGEQSTDGWLAVEYKSQKAWVSGKYGKLEV